MPKSESAAHPSGERDHELLILQYWNQMIAERYLSGSLPQPLSSGMALRLQSIMNGDDLPEQKPDENQISDWPILCSAFPSEASSSTNAYLTTFSERSPR